MTYITVAFGGLVVGGHVIPEEELHRLARTFPARQPDRSIYGGWYTLNLIQGAIEREFGLSRNPRLRYWIRRWLLNHGYEIEPRKGRKEIRRMEKPVGMVRAEVEAINGVVRTLLDVLLSYIAEDHLAEWKRARQIIEATQFIELPGDHLYG